MQNTALSMKITGTDECQTEDYSRLEWTVPTPDIHVLVAETVSSFYSCKKESRRGSGLLFSECRTKNVKAVEK